MRFLKGLLYHQALIEERIQNRKVVQDFYNKNKEHQDYLNRLIDELSGYQIKISPYCDLLVLAVPDGQ